MKLSNLVALSSLLIPFAAAVPLEKRRIVWVTRNEDVVATVRRTTTVWANYVPTALGGAAMKSTNSYVRAGNSYRSRYWPNRQSTSPASSPAVSTSRPTVSTDTSSFVSQSVASPTDVASTTVTEDVTSTSTEAATTIVTENVPTTSTEDVPTTFTEDVTITSTEAATTTLTEGAPITFTAITPTTLGTLTEDVPTTFTELVPTTLTEDVTITSTEAAPTTLTEDVTITSTEAAATTSTEDVPITVTNVGSVTLTADVSITLTEVVGASTFTLPIDGASETTTTRAAPKATSISETSFSAPSITVTAATSTDTDTISPSAFGSFYSLTSVSLTTTVVPTTTSIDVPTTTSIDVPTATSIDVEPTTAEATFTTAAALSASSTLAAPAPSSTPTSSGNPSGTTYTGDITWYDTGLGSCGWTNTNSEAVVAIPWRMMNNPANPNLNPLCGQYITISHGGVQRQAKIVDTCGGCDGASIDLTPSLFEEFATLAIGRVGGVNWWYNN